MKNKVWGKGKLTKKIPSAKEKTRQVIASVKERKALEVRLQIQERRESGYARINARAKKYGLTADDIIAILKKQDSKCAICKDIFIAMPMIDHDHKTGKVRGLLCRHCNTGLGFFRDDVDKLSGSASYLIKHYEKSL